MGHRLFVSLAAGSVLTNFQNEAEGRATTSYSANKAYKIYRCVGFLSVDYNDSLFLDLENV